MKRFECSAVIDGVTVIHDVRIPVAVQGLPQVGGGRDKSVICVSDLGDFVDQERRECCSEQPLEVLSRLSVERRCIELPLGV